ncbi:MAG: sigma 54-interacting transcriptional regulator [Nitrospirae bacterium]|nr:sigma 54-interacting transcriptional regulator [Nitrospirota bacterium]
MKLAENWGGRLGRWSLLLLCAGVLFYIGTVLHFLTHQPYYGGLLPFVDRTLLAVQPGGQAEAAGIRKGDRIVAVEGEEITGQIHWMQLAKRHGRIGEQVILTVERDGFREAIPITVKAHPLPPMAIPAALAGLFCVALGLLVVFKRGAEPGAKTLSLWCLSSAVLIVGSIRWVKLAESTWFFAPWVAVTTIYAPLLLHFTLALASGAGLRPSDRRSPYRLLLYVPSALYLGGMVALLLHAKRLSAWGMDDLEVFRPLIQITMVFLVHVPLYLGATAIGLVRSYVSTPAIETKRQIRWIFWAAVLTLLTILVGVGPFLARDFASFLWGGLAPSLLVFIPIMPLACTLAFFRYRLMDIELLVSRGVAYLASAVLAVGLFLLILAAVSWSLRTLTLDAPVATTVLSALCVALVFHPLRQAAKSFVDRRFFPERQGFRKKVLQASGSLTTLLDRDDIVQATIGTAVDALHLRQGVVFLQDGTTGRFERTATAGEGLPAARLALAPDNPLAQALPETGKGLSRFEIQNRARFAPKRAELLAAMAETECEAVIPLFFETELRGFLGLGSKLSGDLFATEEMDLMQTLANQAATALENSASYAKVTDLNRRLKAQVEKIESQQGQILSLQERLVQENVYLREEIRDRHNFEEVIGSSPAIREVLDTVGRVAPTPSTVLLLGETGTGKELIARAIHFNSLRRDEPFVRFNCAALPEGLVESELFGHEKGAFTGAVGRKTGRFELAHKGTIFLDEIGDTSPGTQVRLLRVLQEKAFERLGGTETIRVNARVIAASNQDLGALISAGKFREDLFYRLNVVAIRVPPLRDRRSDVYPLVLHFMNKYNKAMGKNFRRVDEEVMAALVNYAWPGNVRELENVLERAMALGTGDTLTAQHLPAEISFGAQRGDTPQHAAQDSLLPHTLQDLEELEKERLLAALEKARGNRSRAARLLGIPKSTMWDKLKKHGLMSGEPED